MAVGSTVDLAELEANLSALVDRAAAGEDIVIAGAGRPVARITALPDQEPRQPGIARHWEIDDEALLAPADAEELDWANGKYTDELGISLPRKR
jgi:prevent-host-death family protein